jgi:hypothetical protein
MFSNWPPSELINIKQSAGVYHFFEKCGNVTNSIYVGKAGFGNTDDWNLYERLKQHFQPSQKNALLGKAAKKMCISREDAKQHFTGGNFYLQWVAFNKPDKMEKLNLEKEILRFEAFAISILDPALTDS